MIKTAYRKTKKFLHDNDEVVFLVTAGAVLTAASIAAVVWSTKQYNTELADYEEAQMALTEFTKKSNAEGKAVYLLADGSYIAVRPQDVS